MTDSILSYLADPFTLRYKIGMLCNTPFLSCSGPDRTNAYLSLSPSLSVQETTIPGSILYSI